MSNKRNVDCSYFKVNSTNRRCISNDVKLPLPDTTQEQNKLPLVKSMIKSSSIFNFSKELKQCYPDAPDEVLALFEAVSTNNSSLVRNLIKYNEIEVDYAFPPMTNSVLHLAAYEGYTDIVKILVEEGHASSYKNMIGFLPIRFAIQSEHVAVVKYLYNRSPETKALMKAVRKKDASYVRRLIKSNKVDVNYAYPMWENTVLHVAAAAGSLEIVKILVEEGQAESNTNKIDDLPIHRATQNGHIDVVQYLYESGL